jgi:hypothetical protein
MKTIRARLERLDREKRELMQSQSVGERGKEPSRDFKVRRVSKV